MKTDVKGTAQFVRVFQVFVKKNVHVPAETHLHLNLNVTSKQLES